LIFFSQALFTPDNWVKGPFFGIKKIVPKVVIGMEDLSKNQWSFALNLKNQRL